jgi:hypothetical protein
MGHGQVGFLVCAHLHPIMDNVKELHPAACLVGGRPGRDGAALRDSVHSHAAQGPGQGQPRTQAAAARQPGPR